MRGERERFCNLLPSNDFDTECYLLVDICELVGPSLGSRELYHRIATNLVTICTGHLTGFSITWRLVRHISSCTCEVCLACTTEGKTAV